MTHRAGDKTKSGAASKKSAIGKLTACRAAFIF
jgi:hypothetical protein